MLYNINDCWGFWTLTSIGHCKNTKEYNVSETGVTVLRRGGGKPEDGNVLFYNILQNTGRWSKQNKTVIPTEPTSSR